MSVLKNPVNTEKMTLLGELDDNKQYAFKVDIDATKPQIKKAIEEMYDVKVESIRTMRYAGKKRSRFTKGGYVEGRSPHFKKAMVTLASGDSIDFFKNI